jgi:hypothetical protein
LQQSTTLVLARLRRQGAWIIGLPRWTLVVFIGLLGILRTGFYWYQTDWAILRDQISIFPEALTWQATSWGNLAIARLFGFSEPWHWYGMHAVLTLLAFLLPLFLIRSLSQRGFAVFLFLWALAPVWSTLLMWIGFYDVLTVIGGILIALGSRSWMIVLGAVIMSSGNPEQAILACVAYLILTITPQLRDRRRAAIVATIFAAAAYVPVRIWMTSQDALSRDEHLRSVADGIRFIVNDWPSSIFWWYGVLWILVALFVLAQRGWTILAALMGLIGIPAAAVLVTHDGNRVFWMVSIVTTMAMIRYLSMKAEESEQTESFLPLAAFLVFVVPSAAGGFFFGASTVGGALRSVLGN